MVAVLLVMMLDGSQVRLETANIDVQIQTSYGRLLVPMRDVNKIEFGCHPESETDMVDAIKNLASKEYRTRTDAMAVLKKDKRGAYPYLVAALAKSDDQEVRNRVGELLKEYEGRYTSIWEIKDTVYTEGGIYRGEIRNIICPGESSSLGKINLRVCKMRALLVKAEAKTIKLTTADGWYRVGHRYGHVDIRAKGELDLYPSQPGQYMASPDGSAMNGVFGTNNTPNGFRPGALLGRVNGKVFLVGEHFTTSSMDGALELKINDGAWNATPSGQYEVVVE